MDGDSMYDSIDGLKAGILKDVPSYTDNKTFYCKEKDFKGQPYCIASIKCGYGVCSKCTFK